MAQKCVWTRTMKLSISALWGGQCTGSWTESGLWASWHPREWNWTNHFSSLFSKHTFRCSLCQYHKLLKAQNVPLWCLYFTYLCHPDLEWTLTPHEVQTDTAGCYWIPYCSSDGLNFFRNSGEGLRVCLGKQVKPQTVPPCSKGKNGRIWTSVNLYLMSDSSGGALGPMCFWECTRKLSKDLFFLLE